MSEERAYVIGFDLGGTNMVSAVVDRDLKITTREKKKTKAEVGSEAVYERIKKTIRECIESAGIDPDQVRAVGLASPGPLSQAKRIIYDTPNLGFKGFPIGDRLEKDLRIPVLLENDVNAGVYGEYVRGAARGYTTVIGIFPGTGIGGGLILDGRLFRGATGNAGEIGHMIIQTEGPLCGCGQYGCVEALASKTALAKEAVAMAGSGAEPELFDRVGTDFKRYRSGVFADAYGDGIEGVIRIVDRAAWYLGIAMANCVNMLSPEAVVLGGGLVEKLGETYVRAAERSMRKHALAAVVEGVEVLQARLGDDANLIGAASLAWEGNDAG